MDTKDKIVQSLLKGIAVADSINAEFVYITKGEAKTLVKLLDPGRKKLDVDEHPNERLFYCYNCHKSFWDKGTEDPESLAHYGYNTWHAVCPKCGDTAEVNDCYWR